MKDEQALEAEIQVLGLNAPRLTPAHIDGKIKSSWYINPPGTTMTICVLTLVNGFYVTGESAAASPENFDPEIGKKIAYENARQMIWMLEGYLLRERLASGITNPVVVDRGTLGAAIYALERNIGAPGTVEALRQAWISEATPAGSGADAAKQQIPDKKDYPGKGDQFIYDQSMLCWRNMRGEVVPDNEVVRKAPNFYIHMKPDTVLGQVEGKIIGHDRTEEGAPPFGNGLKP